MALFRQSSETEPYREQEKESKGALGGCACVRNRWPMQHVITTSLLYSTTGWEDTGAALAPVRHTRFQTADEPVGAAGRASEKSTNRPIWGR